MSYDAVTITIEDDTRDDRHFYEVEITDFGRPHISEAYTRADEDHKILRWASNDAVVPADIMALTDWQYQDEMTAARDADLDRFAAAYRAAQARRTPEEIEEQRAEMRAAFGPGETVVNVLTGERTVL